MIRKAVILSCFAILLAAECVYFGRDCAAALLRLGGKRAFFRNDHRDAWTMYQRALAWGGDRDVIETDLVELIVFGLDKVGSGYKVDVPLPPEASIPMARRLIARRIRERPYSAFDWSVASDVSRHAARRKRGAMLLDLSALSEEPLENLLLEERQALLELQTATRLEPSNYIYHEFLMDLYTEFGSAAKAAESCRRSVRALPFLDNHRYLWRQDLPPAMLEAAVGGFEDALREESLIPRGIILLETGRILAWHGQDARAEPYLTKALQIDPADYDALMESAMLLLRRKAPARALEMLKNASATRPEDPWADFYAGVAHMHLGQTDLAIAAYQRARQKGSAEIMTFHALGAALEARGLVKEAERQYTAAANLHPQTAEGWSALLDFHLRHRNIRAAQDACSRLSRLNGANGTSSQACASIAPDLQ